MTDRQSASRVGARAPAGGLRPAPVDGGRRVTETFDLSTVPAPLRPVTRVMGRKNGQAIEQTLDRLVEPFS